MRNLNIFKMAEEKVLLWKSFAGLQMTNRWMKIRICIGWTTKSCRREKQYSWNQEKSPSSSSSLRNTWNPWCLIKRIRYTSISEMRKPNVFSWFNFHFYTWNAVLQAKGERELKEFRNKVVTAFIMINAVFVLTIFLLQLNKDTLHLDWPLGVKTNISYLMPNQKNNRIHMVIPLFVVSIRDSRV